MRVPLLFPSTAVIQQLDVEATAANVPVGRTAGYDPDFKEPISEQTAGGQPITSTRIYDDAVRIPCQLEIKTWEELRMIEQGDCPLAKFVIVMHRKDLARLGLLDGTTGNCLIKRNDKLIAIEKRGKNVLSPDEDLYIYKVEPGSAGFGPDGHDLHIGWTTHRHADWSGRSK